MITINSNENNPHTLKLVIGCSYSKAEFQINKVSLNDKNLKPPRHLPYVEVEDELFFTPNGCLLYLIPATEQNKVKLNEWLEWESSVLSPSLASVIGNSSKAKQLKDKLALSLKNLNSSLEGRKFLIDNSLSASDISIWSVLYPLVKNGNLCKEYLNEAPALLKWFETLETSPNVVESLKKYPITPGNVAYQILFSSSKYVTGIDTENNQASSPDHTSENVTQEELTAAEDYWKNGAPILKDVSKIETPILPKPNEKNILITSALPYVNNVPHLGNIIGCVLSADVFARFSRLCNHRVLYICGTDEYGTATETKALEEGVTCQQICDKYFKIHDEIYKWFNISFNHFGRTSTPEQTELCQDMFLQLNRNGFMFTDSVEQLHCEKCDRFLADRFVEGGCPNIGCTYEDARGDQCDGCGKLVNAIELKNPRCKVCGSTPKAKTSTQFFMDLPKLEPLLLHWVKKSSPGWSTNSQTIARAWLKEGLKPRCITRDLKWGIPVPLDGYRNKVFYVWFDAPIGYMSITKGYTKDWQKWWKPEPDTEVTLYNFMAKDNVPFHSIMFPATLLGCNRGYITVSHLMATEYLNYEDGKFSKSRGVGVFGTDAQSTNIPSDVWRFYLLYLRPESQDSNFNWVDLATKNNSELLNNLGNFINRALMFLKNSFKKVIPEMVLNKEDFTLLALCNRELKGYMANLGKAKLRDGIRHILAISKHGNQYMQFNQPWMLLKGTEEEKVRAGTVIGVSCNIVCMLSIILSPYMPETSEKIRKQLNAKEYILSSDSSITNLLPHGHIIGEPFPLFTKIEPSEIEDLKTKFGGKQESASPKDVTAVVPVQKEALQKMIDEQALVVRKLKEGGAEKSIWQPEVAKLLSLKSKLQEVSSKGGGDNDVKADKNALQKMVDEQALVVRKMKEGGAEKSAWQPEVTKLLSLKSQLQEAISKGSTDIPTKEDPKIVEEEITKQGLVVRKLKEGGADKSVWQPEVDKLLALKNKLASITGVSIVQPKGKKGKK